MTIIVINAKYSAYSKDVIVTQLPLILECRRGGRGAYRQEKGINFISGCLIFTYNKESFDVL